jgi:hypothetical protein
MKKAKWMGALAAGLLIGTSAPAEHRCSKWTRGGGLIEGYNCAYPSDASGPPLFLSERVTGKVRWAASLPDLYGLYEFDAAYLFFVVRGKSRIQPVVGDEVEIVIQSVLYGGMLESFR